MTIREATPSDVPHLVELGQHFRSQSIYARCFAENPARIGAFFQAFVSAPERLVLVAETPGGSLVGMLVALVTDHLFSGERMATELVWWVEPTHRGVGMRLYRAVEAWARTQGAVALQMGAPSEEVATLYTRLGFTEVERLFQKDLR